MTERTIACPVCDRDLFIEPHVRRHKYTDAQLWFIWKLVKLGLPYKGIARVLGSTKRGIERAVKTARDRGN